MPPHSKTVRGTLDNPKTKAILSQRDAPKTRQLGDAVSLTREDASKDKDTAGGESKDDSRTPGDVYGLKPGAGTEQTEKPSQKERTPGDTYGYKPSDKENSGKPKL